jgi:hypothetical protein
MGFWSGIMIGAFLGANLGFLVRGALFTASREDELRTRILERWRSQLD